MPVFNTKNMEEKVTNFWHRVVEYQVFYGYTVHSALTAAKAEMPKVEKERSDAYAQKKLKSYELVLYRTQLFAAIQKSQELIKLHVSNERG